MGGGMGEGGSGGAIRLGRNAPYFATSLTHSYLANLITVEPSTRTTPITKSYPYTILLQILHNLLKGITY